ncbi:hypothetical protein CLF_102273 [Clonorchis sinensis]|nr:hypothetical protein CLF_102273 [Clonorchis sinensis]
MGKDLDGLNALFGNLFSAGLFTLVAQSDGETVPHPNSSSLSSVPNEHKKQWDLNGIDTTDSPHISEETIKLSRHRTISSDQEKDESPNSGLQCSFCGTQTLERCPKCKWAAYCSGHPKRRMELYRLDGVRSHWTAVNAKTTDTSSLFTSLSPHYASCYPRLIGLSVVPIEVAARQADRQDNDLMSASHACTTSSVHDKPDLQKTLSSVMTKRDTNLDLIYRRAELVRANLIASGGRPTCAICGDPCEQYSNQKEISNGSKLENAMEPDVRSIGSYSGDANLASQKPTSPRLVRFAGLLICTCCVEIQATELELSEGAARKIC